MRAGRPTEAAAAYETPLRLRPGCADAHFNLGTALARSARLAEALPHYQRAIQLKPDALAQFRRALEIQTDAVEAGFGLGNALHALRRPD